MSNPINANTADTFSLKGFVSIGAFADNSRYQTAPLGELSLNSATYSKDRALYSATTSGENPTTIELSVFSSRTTDNPAYETPVPYQQLLLEIAKWSHQQAITGGFTNSSESCRQLLTSHFAGKILDLVVGPMVEQDGIYLPASLMFYILPQGISDTFTEEELAVLERSRIKLWFADQAFAGEYDEFEIEFLSPIDNARLNDFFLVADRVQRLVAARTLEETMLLVHQIKDGKPETKIRTIQFDYVDPLDKTWKLPTNWTFIIYGAAGDNVDSIKDRLSKWILANSTHTREEWAEIFPDIFTSTEFVITPMWSQYAVPNSTLQNGVYSPIVNVQNAIAVARRTSIGTGYTFEHVDRVLATVACPFKSVALLAVGGPENRNGKARLEEIWPDYMAVFTSSLDFDRMKPATQQWVTLLNKMLFVAETMTDFSDLPQNMTRLRRLNADNELMMYVVANFQNVQYLVLSRQSMQQYFAPRGVDALRLTVEGADGMKAMPNAKIGPDIYETTFVALGGTAPYQYELVSVSDENKLAGAQIDPDLGTFTATAVAAGDITITIRVMDDNSTMATKNFTLHLYTPTGP